MTDAGDVEGLLRALAPRALGALVRRRGDFEDAGDAMQEALLAAATEYELAARLTHSIPERRHLQQRAARLA